MIENGEMPLDSYVLIHSDAKYTEAQKQELIKYFTKIENDIRLTHNLPAEQKK